MNQQPNLEIIHGSSRHNPIVLKGITGALQQAKIMGAFYIGYPVIASSDSSLTVDALLVSQTPGLVAFHLFEAGQNYRDYQDRLYYILEANLKKYESLRSGRSLSVPINIVSIFPEGDVPADADEQYPAASINSLADVLRNAKGVVDETLYRKLSAAIQRVTTIKPTKKRANVAKPDSKGAILREIEKEIANLDWWQKAAAIETPDGLQRIRGLAGSGKTVVLALKAAYLYTQHPDWKIAVTFHTRSLYQQFKDLIERFTLEHMGDKPDWQQIHIVHSWGSPSENGIYSIACNAINLLPINYLTAKSRYGARRAFVGVCNELAAAVKGKQLDLYDAMLIDEAQDLPPSFFQIVDALTKQPKRIIWAYDELQNLSETSMAALPDLFGREIMLTNAPDAPRQDIILPVCYRNTPWALTLAHALGFGLFRKPDIVQHFDEPSMWLDIGYMKESGELQAGKLVTLSRARDSYPPFFKKLLSPTDAVASYTFMSCEEQYVWIAEEIKRNIEQDELDPDDVMVVLPDPISQKSEYFGLRRHLESHGIPSNLAGITNDRDTFIEPGAVTISGIYRAKGNEAPMVYIANADHCAIGHELIRLRNILFTGITRSRAWVRLCGVGEQMAMLQQEIDQVVSNNFRLTFTVPTPIQLKTIRQINRDRTTQEKDQIKKAQKDINEIIELIRQDVISIDAMPQLQNLIKEAQRRNEEQ
ncbi:MAG: ATP-binding domain-containing protein [Candidatus Competibacter sp.]|nr:ATP-binding domain-containing protein [Candidatus Competibacter sp.]MDG4583241.1 ATP-binding domain-containing protein [Candidatus Competibacter sp.]